MDDQVNMLTAQPPKKKKRIWLRVLIIIFVAPIAISIVFYTVMYFALKSDGLSNQEIFREIANFVESDNTADGGDVAAPTSSVDLLDMLGATVQDFESEFGITLEESRIDDGSYEYKNADSSITLVTNETGGRINFLSVNPEGGANNLIICGCKITYTAEKIDEIMKEKYYAREIGGAYVFDYNGKECELLVSSNGSKVNFLMLADS